MLPSRAAGDEVRFECNVHALAADPSQRAYAAVATISRRLAMTICEYRRLCGTSNNMLCPFSSLREIDLKTCGSIDDALDGRTKIVDRTLRARWIL
jgi:hypothetical protein